MIQFPIPRPGALCLNRYKIETLYQIPNIISGHGFKNENRNFMSRILELMILVAYGVFFWIYFIRCKFFIQIKDCDDVLNDEVTVL